MNIEARSGLSFGAAVLAGLAAVSANVSGSGDIVPFFVLWTFLGGVIGWASHDPFVARRRILARVLGLAWAAAALWVGVLLVVLVTVWEAARPPGVLEATFLGLPATVFHLAGLYGGVALVLLATFAPDRWLRRSSSVPSEPTGRRR